MPNTKICIYSFSTNEEIEFEAFITDFSDTFTTNWTPQDIYGRMDPIPIYQRTKRSIQFDLDLPSNGIAQSIEIADKLNILVPMAGAGSRFSEAGYTFPKPLIEIHKKTMIQLVLDSLNIKANYIFIVQSKHQKKYK